MIGAATAARLRRLFSAESLLQGESEPIRERIGSQQLRLLTRMLDVFIFVGLNTLLMIVVAFRQVANIDVVVAEAAMTVLSYGIILVLNRRVHRAHLTAAVVRRFRSLYVAAVLALAVAWGALICTTMLVADGGQRSLLFGTTIGLISSAAFVAPVEAALSFWGPLVLAGFIALSETARSIDEMTGVCLLGYTVLTGFCLVFLNRNLVERALNEIRLEDQREVISLLLREFEENASDWLWATDEQLRLEHVSDRLAEVAERRIDEVRALSLLDLIGNEPALAAARPGALSLLRGALLERNTFANLVLPVRVRGELRWWSLTGKPVFDERGIFRGYRGVGADITRARRSEEQIEHLARFDSLTDLPNRILFHDLLRTACGRLPGTQATLLCIDLDDFKSVNDTFGHATGDRMLVEVGQRLRQIVTETDIAARFGGDEFAVLTEADDAGATRLGERIIVALSRPYELEGLSVEIGASIGIAAAPRDGGDPETLLKHADLALYRAKGDGRGIVRCFEPSMDEHLRERQALRTELRVAYERHEFSLAFQPLIALDSLRVTGAEALMRWSHPKQGVLSPNAFIPVAEETGLIISLGAWALHEACRVAAGWPIPARIAVNLSPVQFRDGSLLGVIESALDSSFLPPDRLELELTESILLEASDRSQRVLRQIRDRGVQLVLDDFGTGYSSFQYLRSFSFDKIKIDRSYVYGLAFDRGDQAIVESIISMARGLGIRVTAEGVETAQQMQWLRARGCDQAQGFYFQRPTSPEDLVRYIERTEPGRASSPVAAK